MCGGHRHQHRLTDQRGDFEAGGQPDIGRGDGQVDLSARSS
jgi:hypothetical protein